MLLLVGAVFGALTGAPAMAGDATTGAAIQVRVASCAGLGFHPLNSSTTSKSSGPLRMGNGFQICNPQLPHRAVVKKVTFTVYDNSAYGQVANCALVRHRLTGFETPAFEVLGSVQPTGMTQAFGEERLADDTIDYATIDNQRNGYFLQCQIEEYLQTQGIYGATVSYTISSTDG
jgi:hypothetical protein